MESSEEEREIISGNNSRNSSQVANPPSLTDCSFNLTGAELPLVLFVSSIANVMATITLTRLYRKLRSKNILLITILAANDICSSASILTNNVANTLTCDIFQEHLLCELLGWIGIGSFGWSMFIIATISVERYFMVLHPFFHHTKVTKFRLCVVVLAGAFVSLLFTFLPLVGLGSPYIFYRDNRFCAFNWAAYEEGIPVHTFFVEFLAGYGLLQVSVTFFCNVSIMAHMRCRRNRVAPHTQQNVGTLQAKRFAYLTISIAFFNSICSAPFFVKLIIDGVIQKNHIQGLEDSITSVLLFCTPVINPILYLIFNKSYRKLLFQPCQMLPFCRTKVRPLTEVNQHRLNVKDSAQVTVNVTDNLDLPARTT